MIKAIESFLNARFDFRRNVINQCIEYKVKSATNYEIMNLNDIFRIIQHAGLYMKLEELRSLFKSNFVQSHNPMQNYFDALPAWDGKVDHITKLAEHLKTKNQDDQPFLNIMFKKALVRSIACALYGVVNRIVFVMVSKQEMGKSWFLKKLNPFGEDYYCDLPLRDDKDTMFRFAENFMYNLEELADLKLSEINRMKALISMSLINERKPYAVDIILLKAILDSAKSY